MDNNYDPKLVEKAKKMTAGPLGKEMTKFPMRFAAPVFFGESPAVSKKSKISNGTASLINFGNGNLAITCYHVLSPFKEQIESRQDSIFQIGNLKFNPLDQIIAESEELDIVTISLTPEQAKEISAGGEIGSLFFMPPFWPPNSVNEKDFVAFGGFPGRWRQHLSSNEIMFDTYSSGACGVASVTDEYIVCQFEREYWVVTLDLHNKEELYDISGLSGGPVFIKRSLHWEFIGIIYQFSQEFELMYIRPSKFIGEDGVISS
ncbi:MAG: hypothetical protein E3J23_04250 [Candidatus Stahlbacteria bacterium]|nr:MAG: hypothetical protein E3J23_04250 [Candidatus Stahlbacteria bacterium]